jgi:hypothetical protein
MDGAGLVDDSSPGETGGYLAMRRMRRCELGFVVATADTRCSGDSRRRGDGTPPTAVEPHFWSPPAASDPSPLPLADSFFGVNSLLMKWKTIRSTSSKTVRTLPPSRSPMKPPTSPSS